MSADVAGRQLGAAGSHGSGQDIAALQAALAAEQAANYGYGVVGAHLAGSQFAAASGDCLAHQRARDSLIGMITARGGRPRAAAAAYRLPVKVSTPAEAKALAVLLEHQVTAAYLGLVAVSDVRLRRFAADAMRQAAIRAARWGGRAQAFPGLPKSSLRRTTS